MWWELEGVYAPYFGVPVLFSHHHWQAENIKWEELLGGRGGAGKGPARDYLKKAKTLDLIVKLRQNIQSVQETELFPKAGVAINDIKSCHAMNNVRPFSES